MNKYMYDWQAAWDFLQKNLPKVFKENEAVKEGPAAVEASQEELDNIMNTPFKDEPRNPDEVFSDLEEIY